VTALAVPPAPEVPVRSSSWRQALARTTCGTTPRLSALTSLSSAVSDMDREPSIQPSIRSPATRSSLAMAKNHRYVRV
jgi:hypothetical protein